MNFQMKLECGLLLLLLNLDISTVFLELWLLTSTQSTGREASLILICKLDFMVVQRYLSLPLVASFYLSTPH